MRQILLTGANRLQIRKKQCKSRRSLSARVQIRRQAKLTEKVVDVIMTMGGMPLSVRGETYENGKFSVCFDPAIFQGESAFGKL